MTETIGLCDPRCNFRITFIPLNLFILKFDPVTYKAYFLWHEISLTYRSNLMFVCMTAC